MASEVYTSTTTPNPKSNFCLIPSDFLDKTRFFVKLAEVLLSFVAFILEEVVNNCISCSALYFFEFVSCTAFLFTLLLLVLLSTSLHNKVGITCWPTLDFGYTSLIAVLFFISSILFAAGNNGSTLEKSAVAFGFMALLAFVVDVVMIIKTRGFPWQQGRTTENSNGNAASPENGSAEKERLNTENGQAE